jgi:hypothetical protein
LFSLWPHARYCDSPVTAGLRASQHRPARQRGQQPDHRGLDLLRQLRPHRDLGGCSSTSDTRPHPAPRPTDRSTTPAATTPADRSLPGQREKHSIEVHHGWRIESAFYALRHTLFHQRVLRSATPAGLQQELWGLLILYQLIRTAIIEAAEHRPGTDPDRAGFTIALENAANSLINATGILPDSHTPLAPTRCATAATAALPARRDRISRRKVKSPASRYAYLPGTESRPPASTTVTSRDYTILARTQTPPPTPRTRRKPGTTTQKILDHLHTNNQPVTTGDIALHTGLNHHQTRYKLAQMVNHGDIIRTSPGHFTTKPPTRVLPATQNP